MGFHPLAAAGRFAKRITHLAIQSFNDPWARRLRFAAFLAGSVAMTQLWTAILSGGNAAWAIVILAAMVWIVVYPLMWLRISFVFLWFPGRRRPHRVRVGSSGRKGPAPEGPTPPGTGGH